MEIAQLRALLAVKKFASLTASGKCLGLSTSAVFCQIRQLEEELGKKLYQQVGKSLRLTDTGELLSRYAAVLVDLHDDALSSVKDQGNSKRGLLRIGCGPHSSVAIVPHLVGALLSWRPRTDVRVITSNDQVLIQDLRLGILDAVLMTLPAVDTEFVQFPLWSYKMLLVTPPAARKSKRNSENAIGGELPFILFSRSPVTDFAFQQACYDLNMEPNIVIENDQPDSIKQLVKLGLGMTVLPEWSVVEERQNHNLAITQLKNRTLHNYGVICRRSGYRPKALDDLLAMTRKWRDWWPLASCVSDPV